MERQLLFQPSLGLKAQDSEELDWADDKIRPVDSPEEANLVSSKVAGDFIGLNIHLPVLDLDVPHRLVPSETPGHSHLYIDVAMTWETYSDVLTVLGEAGILEPGGVAASLARGYSTVATKPWKNGKVKPSRDRTRTGRPSPRSARH